MGQVRTLGRNQLRNYGSVFECYGFRKKVIKIDCRTLEYEYHNADFNDYSLILFDSNVKHSLMTSAYNEREQCEEGIAIVKVISRDN
jgi:galactokinase